MVNIDRELVVFFLSSIKTAKIIIHYEVHKNNIEYYINIVNFYGKIMK